MGVGCWVGFLLGFSLTIHSPVLVHFLPLMMTLPLCFTVTSIFVKVISHPASHSVTTESNEWDARPGTMYPIRAFCGKKGRLSWHLWVDLTLFPSGSVTLICCWSPSIIVASAAVIKKLLVAPESKIAQCFMLSFVRVIVWSRFAAAPANP